MYCLLGHFLKKKKTISLVLNTYLKNVSLLLHLLTLYVIKCIPQKKPITRVLLAKNFLSIRKGNVVNGISFGLIK